jgi:hypothetical protein
VDYAVVHYWYQDAPGGYEHLPLPPPEERGRSLLRSSLPSIDLDELLASLAVDPDLRNSFDSPADLDRVLVARTWPGTHPLWIDHPGEEGGHPGNPNPGRQGILAVHARGPAESCVVARKVRLPDSGPVTLRVVVSGDPYEAPGRSDFLLRVGVSHEDGVSWRPTETIDAGSSPSAENWRTLRYDLSEYAGRTVVVLVTTSYGGAKSAGMNEEAFFDEISVLNE